MKFTKIHEVLNNMTRLRLKLILIPKKRKNVVNSFEKKIKLMINSVYGKPMENLRKRINVRLVNNARDYKKYVSKPSFVSQKIFSKSLVPSHEIELVLTLHKPIYIGFSVLNLSRIFMYDYHYNYIKRKLLLSCYLQTQIV